MGYPRLVFWSGSSTFTCWLSTVIYPWSMIPWRPRLRCRPQYLKPSAALPGIVSGTVWRISSGLGMCIQCIMNYRKRRSSAPTPRTPFENHGGYWYPRLGEVKKNICFWTTMVTVLKWNHQIHWKSIDTILIGDWDCFTWIKRGSIPQKLDGTSSCRMSWMTMWGFRDFCRAVFKSPTGWWLVATLSSKFSKLVIILVIIIHGNPVLTRQYLIKWFVMFWPLLNCQHGKIGDVFQWFAKDPWLVKNSLEDDVPTLQ